MDAKQMELGSVANGLEREEMVMAFIHVAHDLPLNDTYVKRLRDEESYTRCDLYKFFGAICEVVLLRDHAGLRSLNVLGNVLPGQRRKAEIMILAYADTIVKFIQALSLKKLLQPSDNSSLEKYLFDERSSRLVLERSAHAFMAMEKALIILMHDECRRESKSDENTTECLKECSSALMVLRDTLQFATSERRSIPADGGKVGSSEQTLSSKADSTGRSLSFTFPKLYTKHLLSILPTLSKSELPNVP